MQNRRLRSLVLALFVGLVFSVFGMAQTVSPPGSQGAPAATAPTGSATTATQASTHGSDLAHGTHQAIPKVLLALLLMLALAKIGGDLMERVGQPAVLGELIFGIVLGNLALLKLGFLDQFITNVVHDPTVISFLTILAEIGVILLLFEVGLESTVREMLSVGLSSLVVAILGVTAPLIMGFVLGVIFLSHEPWTVHLFLGAVMAATSVGITARVLRDIGQMERRESKIILGAAVIDDILGLVILAVAQGAVVASNTGTTLSIAAILLIIVKAVGFFVVAIVLGMLLSRRMFWAATFLRVQGVLLTLTLAWCFLIAYLGSLVGVAPIVGAFAAGLVLEDATFRDWKGGERELETLLRPITAFLVPVFFVFTGMNVNLQTFANPSILGFAAVLTIVAILAKQVCALGVWDKTLNRQAIGFGMVPRGEVGLIVASIGRTMKTPEGHPVISDNTFSAVVIMVVVTTMITPPALKWSMLRKGGGAAPPQPEPALPEPAPAPEEKYF
jgi:Kef-type K+ transport system membrane component KefB